MTFKPIRSLINNPDFAMKLLGILSAVLVGYVLAFGDSRWVKKADFDAQAAMLAPIPAQVKALEVWESEDKALHLGVNGQFAGFQNTLTELKVSNAALSAQMVELIKSNDRVLRKLDNER